ncbi:MAG: hypothetical protein RLT05_17505, partial [Bauldia litoralis]
GSAAAVPAVAATPGAPGAAPLGGVQHTVPVPNAGQALPVRHYYRNRAYCSRQYRLGFALGNHGARVFFNRHCHPSSRGRNWRGRHWDRGYRSPRNRHHHRRNHRSYQNQR